MTASDRFFITSLFIKDKSDSKSTVPTTCYLPDFFIFGKPFTRISLYIRSYGSVKCRPFSCQAGGRGFESLRSRKRINTTYLSIKASLNCGAFSFISNHTYSLIHKSRTQKGRTHFWGHCSTWRGDLPTYTHIRGVFCLWDDE